MTFEELLAEVDRVIAQLDADDGPITDEELKLLNYGYHDLLQVRMFNDSEDLLAPEGSALRKAQYLEIQNRFQAINAVQVRRIQSGVRMWARDEVERRRSGCSQLATNLIAR